MSEFRTHIISDVDSTIVSMETLDFLCQTALRGHPKQHELGAQVEDITEQGMSGQISFDQSLKDRVEVLIKAGATRFHVAQTAEAVAKSITPSFLRNAPLIREMLRAGKFTCASGGFEDYLTPGLGVFGVCADQIHANRFIYDAQGRIVGFDTARPLAQNNGKAELIRQLRADNIIVGHAAILGDGENDRQGKAEGAADEFWHFKENKPNRILESDYVMHSFDDVVTHCQRIGSLVLRPPMPA